MERQYDVLVIGTGITSIVASRCREAGRTVAVIDSRPFGGTCALRGCVPKKVLVTAADAVHAARDLSDKGVPAKGLTIDWTALMRFKRAFVEPTPARTEEAWAKIGIDQFHGRARFLSPTTVSVNADRLTARHVVIAAGAMPAPLTFPGANKLVTSEQFLDVDALPSRVVFVGGGYIAFEFAHVAARAGVQATILHRGPRPLERFDPDLVDLLLRRSREIGIRVEVDTEVEAVEVRGDRLLVRGRRHGQELGVEADLAVHAAGRVPELDDLSLETAGVERGRRGVVVNEYLQSVSNPAIYAGGDAAASGPPLTPKAYQDAAVIAANLIEGNHRTPNYDGIASAVFTIPPLASAGLTEAEAHAARRNFRTHTENTSGWFNTRRVGETTSGFKVLIEHGTDHILGAHLFGPGADETINLFAAAIRLGIRARDLGDVLFAYPTFGWDTRWMV